MKLPTISSNCTVNRGNAPAAANGQGRVEFLDSRIVVVGSNGSRHSPALLALPGSIWNGSHSSLSTVLTVVAFVFVFVVLSRFLYVPGLIGGNDDWADAVRYMPEYTPADRLFEPSLDGIELARHVWMVMLLGWLFVGVAVNGRAVQGALCRPVLLRMDAGSGGACAAQLSSSS